MAIFSVNTIKEKSNELIQPAKKTLEDLFNNINNIKTVKSVLDIPDYWQFDSFKITPQDNIGEIYYSAGLLTIDLGIPFTFTSASLYHEGKKKSTVINDYGEPTFDPTRSPILKNQKYWEIDFKYFNNDENVVIEFNNTKIANQRILEYYNANFSNIPNELFKYSTSITNWSFFANQVKTAIYLSDKLNSTKNVQDFMNILLGVPAIPVKGTVINYEPTDSKIYVRIRSEDKYFDYYFPRVLFIENCSIDVNEFVEGIIGRQLKRPAETLFGLILLETR